MDELLRVLKEIKPTIDFEHETDMIQAGLLDSMDIVEIIDAISEHYTIELAGDDIDPDNFVSAEKIWEMIQRYQ